MDFEFHKLGYFISLYENLYLNNRLKKRLQI